MRSGWQSSVLEKKVSLLLVFDFPTLFCEWEGKTLLELPIIGMLLSLTYEHVEFQSGVHIYVCILVHLPIFSGRVDVIFVRSSVSFVHPSIASLINMND